MQDVTSDIKNTMEIHCVYIPDVILVTCRMLCFCEKKHKHHEIALCLYSECHYVYMPDEIVVKHH